MSYHEILQSIGHLYMLSFLLFSLPFVPNSREWVCEADFTKSATGIWTRFDTLFEVGSIFDRAFLYKV